MKTLPPLKSFVALKFFEPGWTPWLGWTLSGSFGFFKVGYGVPVEIILPPTLFLLQTPILPGKKRRGELGNPLRGFDFPGCSLIMSAAEL
jgi:hypothetical protein